MSGFDCFSLFSFLFAALCTMFCRECRLCSAVRSFTSHIASAHHHIMSLPSGQTDRLNIDNDNDKELMGRILHILRSSRQCFSWTHCREWYQKGALACCSEDECPNMKSLEDIDSESPQLLSFLIDSTICHNCFREALSCYHFFGTWPRKLGLSLSAKKNRRLGVMGWAASSTL
ncbi:hypothetical protein B0T25DRAFT_299877 [Lasiosphaeria hispida]|uniref:Secreted protein n=1 Tax=Lasiosphaeria hispida TaxID=260671 RepID=A0AAJ0H7X6_9PEZI|nr:hypothetical protein B0T25DRAFT_299877 [Lasiosphaeria hispida]